MAKATEDIPHVEYDIVEWDGKPHAADEHGETIEGHPFVAFSHVDDLGVAHGHIWRKPEHVLPGESSSVAVKQGDAVISTPDGQHVVLPLDEAKARFKFVPAAETKDSHKKLPKGTTGKAADE